MNIIARVLATLILAIVSWIGTKVGVPIDVTPAEALQFGTQIVLAIIGLYGALHPLIRSWLVRRFGHGARTSDGAGQVKP